MDSETQINVRATLRYVGTHFAGWQIQPDQRTVQGEIERTLAQIAGAAVRIHGAGRTDAGVHAAGQVCSFRWDASKDLGTLRRSLTRMLAPEIQFTNMERAPEDFHARKSAVGKRYWYSFSTAREPDPFSAAFAWTLPAAVDISTLHRLCARMEGTHDFAGFQSSGVEKESTIRTLFGVRILPGGILTPADVADVHHIEFHGDGFLYKMVRNITGTLVDIARGKVPESRIEERLAGIGPYRGYTAPAHGLALAEVLY